MQRRTNTAKEMLASGAWIVNGRKGGKPVYEHMRGAVIAYDCNAWAWRVNGVLTSPLLWVALSVFNNQQQQAFLSLDTSPTQH